MRTHDATRASDLGSMHVESSTNDESPSTLNEVLCAMITIRGT